jgi:allantoinase
VEPYDCVIRGEVVLPDRIVAGGSIAVADGRIAAVLEARETVPARVVHDHSGRYVMPGLVDTHVHAGSFEAEDLLSTTSSAAAGGVTTIMDMPYDRLGPVMGIRRLQEKVEEVRSSAVVDVGLYGTMAKVGGVGALEELVAGGVCAFKFSLFEYDAHRFPRIPDGDLVAAFAKLSATRIPIVLHNELQEVVEYRLAEVLGTPRESDPYAHGYTHPPVSETAASVKALDFAYWTGARLHLAHCTHPHTFRLIDWYRQMGAAVSGETCAHYLTLDEGDVAALGPIAKVNPPIRDEESREALWKLLGDGKIATVSTDHAPWPIESKQRSILRASAGMPGLETFLPAVVTAGAHRGFPLPDLLGYLTWRPAEVFGVGDRKGRLAVGFDADIAVFDARSPWTFDAAQSLSSARWSPFDGHRFDGRVEATYVRGRPVFADGRVVAEPGYGRWLRPAHAGA